MLVHPAASNKPAWNPVTDVWYVAELELARTKAACHIADLDEGDGDEGLWIL